MNICDDCETVLYSWDDGRGGIEYTCPKCDYNDLPSHIQDRCPEFKPEVEIHG